MTRRGGPPPPPPPPPAGGYGPRFTNGPSYGPGYPPPLPGQNPSGQYDAHPPPPPPQTFQIPRTIISSSVMELDHREEYDWDEMPADTVLMDEQAQLCPAIIGGVSLSNEHLYNVSVENLQPVKWNKGAMERLVLDEDKKDLLKGLVAQHSHRARTSEFGDLIENKGKGLVILLHGPPGVSGNLSSNIKGFANHLLRNRWAKLSLQSVLGNG